jgi:hypothetical protein
MSLKSLAVVWELATGGALGEWHQQEAALLDNVNTKHMAGADIDYGRFWVLAFPGICSNVKSRVCQWTLKGAHGMGNELEVDGA